MRIEEGIALLEVTVEIAGKNSKKLPWVYLATSEDDDDPNLRFTSAPK